jgi:hypothetical protein
MEIEADSFEDALDQVLSLESHLTSEQRSQLSKVLFPDTHTDKVKLLGKERTLRPLTIKFSRRIHEALLPFNDKARKASEDETVFRLDGDIVEALYSAARILSEYYGWEDVPKAVAEEDVMIDELQLLVNVQQRLQGDNDFLLAPLRVLIKLMQTREILEQRMLVHGRSSSASQP